MQKNEAHIGTTYDINSLMPDFAFDNIDYESDAAINGMIFTAATPATNGDKAGKHNIDYESDSLNGAATVGTGLQSNDE
eukprot:scaffold40098_cov36-Cyclotella_meneghiniana.AAC.3